MNYTYDLILKKSNRRFYYQLVTKDNIIFYEFTAGSWVDAEIIAKAYMSTWESVQITVEKDDVHTL